MTPWLVAAVIALAAGVLHPIPAPAAGPWKGRIVDAETGQPLAGAVVVFSWIEYTAGPAGWAGGEFHDAAEGVTGADGAFVIPARSTLTLLPWKKIAREVAIFKPGYGRWRFQGSDEWERLPPRTRTERYNAAWTQAEQDGVVIELPPLKTREARLDFYQRGGRTPPGVVPAGRIRRFIEADDAERAYLGLTGKR
jgi:hypothetical protein